MSTKLTSFSVSWFQYQKQATARFLSSQELAANQENATKRFVHPFHSLALSWASFTCFISSFILYPPAWLLLLVLLLHSSIHFMKLIHFSRDLEALGMNKQTTNNGSDHGSDSRQEASGQERKRVYKQTNKPCSCLQSPARLDGDGDGIQN